MLNNIAIRSSKAGDGSGDQTWVKCYGSTSVGDLHRAAIGDSLEEAQEGNLMGSETRIRRRRASDLGDVNRSAGKRRQSQALSKGPVSCKSKEFRRRMRHFAMLGGIFGSRNISSPSPKYRQKLIFCRRKSCT